MVDATKCQLTISSSLLQQITMSMRQAKYRGPEKGKGGRSIIGPDERYLPNPQSRQQFG